MGELVFIDSTATGDMDKVPEAVKTALNGQEGPIPKVALSDATGAKVYGTASHTELKGGLATAMKAAKRALLADQKAGTAPKAEAATAKSDSSSTESESGASSSSSSSPGNPVVTEKNGAKEITGAPLEQWTSSKGSSVTARLTKVTGTKVTFVTDKGRTITLGQAELAPASYQRVQEILGAK
jgi:hypothetical protein